MKKIGAILSIVALALGSTGGVALAEKARLINGAGATFPYPIYSKWFSEYAKIDPSVNFNYQSIGSGGGIKQISAQTVDFGASDAFLTNELLRAAPGKLLHIPMVAGAVTVVYNLDGVSSGLKLTPDILADIFMGKVTLWNDSRITSINPGIELPAKAIVVCHRSDGSGTTNIFTDYLSNVSPSWKNKVGMGTAVSWPVGLGGKGNEGVAGLMIQMPGAIGYVELAYAKKNNLSYAALQNKAGNFIEPSIEATTAAVAGKAATMPDDFRVSIVNADGDNAYPISGFTWILIYKNQKDPFVGQKLVEFLKWAVHEGQTYTNDLHYAPLPENVVTKIDHLLDEVNV